MLKEETKQREFIYLFNFHSKKVLLLLAEYYTCCLFTPERNCFWNEPWNVQAFVILHTHLFHISMNEWNTNWIGLYLILKVKLTFALKSKKKKKLPFADSLKQGDKSMNYIIQPLIVFHI